MAPLFQTAVTQQQILLALDQIEKARKAQNEQVKVLFDQTKAYQTTIIGLAYGGFFAIWAYARTFVTDTKFVALAGALMGLAIFLFAIFEILNMLFLTFVTLRTAEFSRTIKTPTDLSSIPRLASQISKSANDLKEGVEAAALKLIHAWPWFFVTSLLSGVAAALIFISLLLKYALVAS